MSFILLYTCSLYLDFYVFYDICLFENCNKRERKTQSGHKIISEYSESQKFNT